VLATTAGCGFKAHHIDPKPWIEGRRLPASLRVQVSDALEERFVLAGGDGIPDLDVHGWRAALLLGLERARPQRFADPVDNAWQLVLEEAEVTLLAVDWGPDGNVALFKAQVRYQALLFDDQNVPLGELEGTITSKKPFQGVSDASPLLADAIETLSEELVQRTAEIVERKLELPPT
jgi:hypothetical protein